MKLRATIECGQDHRRGGPTWRIATRHEVEVYPTYVKIKFPDANKLELLLSYEELSDLMTQIQLKQEVKS